MGKKIAIIGGGNLGSAIAEGLLISGFCKPADLIVTKRNISSLTTLKEKGVRTSSDNNKAVQSSEIIILAIKPFQVTEVLTGITKTPASIKIHIIYS